MAVLSSSQELLDSLADSSLRLAAAGALDLLAEDSRLILASWRVHLRSAGQDPTGLVPIDFAKFAASLRNSPPIAIERQIQLAGGRMARKGITPEQMLGALNRLLETCIRRLRDKSAGSDRILVLASLHATVAQLLVSGFMGRLGSRLATRVETDGAETSHYISKVYEQERRRLAQDLHDEVGHDLVLTKLYLEMIALDTKDQDLPQVQPRLAEAIALVSQAITEVRRIGLDLGPAVFEELGFLPAVKSYACQFAARTKINVEVREGRIPENLPATHQVALYRLLQGALGNVVKHASARNVRISLGGMKDTVIVMVIEDDGVGFQPPKRDGARSYGLATMRERIKVLGGRLHIGPARTRPFGGRGTRIEVDLPLPTGGME